MALEAPLVLAAQVLREAHQADLVEEVARIVGYDSIPTTMLTTSIPH